MAHNDTTSASSATAGPFEAAPIHAFERPAGTDQGINALKGIACVLLVMLHVVGDTPDMGLRLADDHIFNQFNAVFMPLRMPLFAMLAGFVYAWRPARPQGLGSFVSSKARRLALPFAFAATLFAGASTVLGGAFGMPLTQFWTIYVFGYAQFWFIQALLVLFLIAAIIDTQSKAFNSVLMLGVWVMACAFYATGVLEEVNFLSLGRALYLAPYFFGGILIWRLRQHLSHRVIFTAAIVASLLWAIHISQILHDPLFEAVRRGPFALGLGLIGAGALLGLRGSVPVMSTLGRYSFAIYLYHWFAIQGVIFVYDFTGRPGDYAALAIGLSAGLFAPILAQILAQWVGGPLALITLGLKSDSGWMGRWIASQSRHRAVTTKG
ncbi:acyltransferase family protein [Woodsholea maritima]|uniref:acyltransferase family protein n=1 Tax=Woodsholea maritima TaxID=240237 RepID=UPI00039DD4EA|nr:acyltransferase [Woodsholea maritima]